MKVSLLTPRSGQSIGYTGNSNGRLKHSQHATEQNRATDSTPAVFTSCRPLKVKLWLNPHTLNKSLVLLTHRSCLGASNMQTCLEGLWFNPHKTKLQILTSERLERHWF